MSRAEELVRLAPPLRESEKKAVNKLFQAYLFIAKGNEVWASCCGTHKIIDRAETNGEYELITAPHCPEPQYRWYHNLTNPESAWRVSCPWCGAEAKVKRLQYSGARKNLWSYRRCVVLRWWRGALWAVAYEFTKDYSQRSFDGKPVLLNNLQSKMMGVYRFQMGKAEGTMRHWYPGSYFGRAEVQTQAGEPGSRGSMWHLTDPYSCDSEWGTTYDVIGMEEISESPLRYCGIKAGENLIEELTACCFYGRKIEMVRKAGMEDVVRDLVDRGVRTADLFWWNAKDPADFLKSVTVRDVRCAAGSKMPVVALRLYKSLRGTAAESPLEQCIALVDKLYEPWNLQLRRFVRRIKTFGLRVGRIHNYLEKQRGERETIWGVAQTWTDYLDAAELMGIDMKNPLHQLPGDLRAKHDQYARAKSALAAEKKQRDFREGRLTKLVQKYLWWNEDYLIRPAVSCEEIVREGKLLEHCVGGYADRYMSGKVTILFLRRKDRPGTPLVTIEMDGNRIVQAHGFHNEWQPCPDNPKKIPIQTLYAELLGQWLRWLEKGSKRNADGTIPQRKRRKKSA